MIEVEALKKVYPGEVQAVKGISFTVDPGEVFGLLGPNGAGKSTTVGMLTTTVAPTSGTARLAGRDVVVEPLDVIAGLRKRSELTLLWTTHYLDEAERLCDRVAIMHKGEIVALDTPAALRASLGAELVELRVDGDGEQTLRRLRDHGIAGP